MIIIFRLRIRELRESAGYKSQQSFADAFGIAQSTVGGWEAGKREPNYETTSRLADFFDVSVDYLLGRTDQKSMSTAGTVSSLSSTPPSKSHLTADDLLLEISHQYGEKTATAFSMYLSLNSEDRGEIRGQMKQMLISSKTSTSSSNIPFSATSDESVV